MKSCEEYIELISAAMDGEISDADRSELKTHLKSCPECRKVAEAFVSITKNFPMETPVPENFTAGTMAKIKSVAAQPSGFKKFISGYGKYTGIAAALVVIMLGANVFTNGFGGNKAADTAAPAAANTGTYSAPTESADAEESVTESELFYSANDGNAEYNTTTTGDSDFLADMAVPESAPNGAGGAMPEPMPSAAPAEPQAPAADNAELHPGKLAEVTDVNELYAERGYTERFYSVNRLYAPASEELSELLNSSESDRIFSSTREHHYKVPMDKLNELDPEAFTEIVFDDLTAKHGLVIIMTPEED